MQLWDTIINTAMMGTDKKQISSADLPTAFEEAATLINNNNTKDKEEKFLQLAALTFNYRQCGTSPLQKEIMMPPAIAEDRQYCNTYAIQTLKDILTEESIPLLKFWLQLCYEKQKIATPEVIPLLLQTGEYQKKIQLLIAASCGKRGEWLASFNPAWNFSSAQNETELWQTGTFEQRKEVLKQIRKANPAKAREWLQETWTNEDANTRAAFLEILTDNTNADDIPFLESLSGDKSKKVKEAAVELLKQIPGSSVVSLYEKTLSESVILKKEKALLGMVNKTVLHCKLPGTLDEAIYKTGIDKLSNTKEMTDDEYVIFQLMHSVPPSFWEGHFGMKPENIIEMFQKDAVGKKLIPALLNAIIKFADSKWAIFFMQYSETFYIDIIPYLPLQQQEYYSNQFFEKYPDNIIRYAVERQTEWSLELAKKIFKHAAKSPYQYNRTFFNQHIDLIPVQIVGELERCTPPEEHMRVTWSNTSEYIIKLINLKIQTIKAFNS